MSSAPGERRFGAALGIVVSLGVALRVLYLLAQPGTDPWFGVPQLDGATYVAWAEAIAGGRGGVSGAYYLAPLYPWTLALLLRAGGDSALWLYAAQQALSVVTACGLALAARPIVGAWGAVAGAALFLGYAPILFFASRPVGESLALALLAGALALALRARHTMALGLSGVLAGAAALARPNLLLVALAWVGVEVVRREARRALLIGAGVALAVFPVTLRNVTVSGHWVVISSNAGITLYHGNGRGEARVPDNRPCGPEPCGIYRHPDGLPRGLETIEAQRDAALAVARVQSGRPLDAVEADAWWGARAVRDRMAHPADTLLLLLRRAALLLDPHEFGLDYPPRLDPNPWRPILRVGRVGEIGVVPWAALVALAAAAVAARGWGGSGGAYVWSAIAACAAMPLVFYVSSRYRLPVAALLALPAGAGLVTLLRRGPRRGRALASAVGAVILCCAASAAIVPRAELVRHESGGALANRSIAWRRSGHLDAALADAREAVRRVPESAWLHYNLGVVLAHARQLEDAETAYRESLRLEPELAEASVNLSGLHFAQGRFDEAVRVLRAAVLFPSAGEACFTNLVAALVAAGDRPGAAAALAEARGRGIEVPEGLVRVVEDKGPGDTP